MRGMSFRFSTYGLAMFLSLAIVAAFLYSDNRRQAGKIIGLEYQKKLDNDQIIGMHYDYEAAKKRWGEAERKLDELSRSKK
jgi:hypothetical protein